MKRSTSLCIRVIFQDLNEQFTCDHLLTWQTPRQWRSLTKSDIGAEYVVCTSFDLRPEKFQSSRCWTNGTDLCVACQIGYFQKTYGSMKNLVPNESMHMTYTALLSTRTEGENWYNTQLLTATGVLKCLLAASLDVKTPDRLCIGATVGFETKQPRSLQSGGSPWKEK